MRQRYVVNPPRLDRIDMRPGRRGAADVEAGFDEGLELGAQEPIEAHVSRRDVNQARSRVDVAGTASDHRVEPA